MGKVVVLMYHHISPNEGAHTVKPEHFCAQLKRLHSEGYRFLSAEEFAAWRGGSLHLDRPGVVVTFDDGWIDNWVYALPVLEQFRIPSIFFVVTGWPGEGPSRAVGQFNNRRCPTHTEAMNSIAEDETRDGAVMRWSELLAARETGLVSLQCHSQSHGLWWQGDFAWRERLLHMRKDLIRSREILNERTGHLPDHLCWPRGQFTLDMVQTAQQLGFTHQYTTLRGGNGPSTAPLVRRIHVENRSGEWLSRTVGLYANPLAGRVLAQTHQLLYRRRMLKMWHGRIPEHDLSLPFWRLV